MARHLLRRTRRLFLESLESRRVLAAIPTVTLLNVPAVPLLGEEVEFTVRFDNTSPIDTGFGPFVNLFLPATGADGAGAEIDDGLTFVSASYLGNPVQATVVTLTDAGVPHPFAKDSSGNPVVILPPAGFEAGDQLVVLAVPYGSFTPSQPLADISVSTVMSNLADVDAPLMIQAQGGFRLGNDGLDNPQTDPSLIGAPVTASTFIAMSVCTWPWVIARRGRCIQRGDGYVAHRVEKIIDAKKAFLRSDSEGMRMETRLIRLVSRPSARLLKDLAGRPTPLKTIPISVQRLGSTSGI